MSAILFTSGLKVVFFFLSEGKMWWMFHRQFLQALYNTLQWWLHQRRRHSSMCAWPPTGLQTPQWGCWLPQQKAKCYGLCPLSLTNPVEPAPRVTGTHCVHTCQTFPRSKFSTAEHTSSHHREVTVTFVTQLLVWMMIVSAGKSLYCSIRRKDKQDMSTKEAKFKMLAHWAE